MLISTLLQSEADNRYCPNAIHAIPPLLPTQRLQLCRASLPDRRFQPHLPCLTSLGSRPLDPLRLLKNPRYPQETARHHPLILRPPFPPPRQEGRHRSFGGGPERTRERADEGVEYREAGAGDDVFQVWGGYRVGRGCQGWSSDVT